MNDGEKYGFLAFLLFSLLGVMFIFYNLGKTDSTFLWQKEAIKQGHAEFYLDTDFNKQFRWLPAQDGKTSMTLELTPEKTN